MCLLNWTRARTWVLRYPEEASVGYYRSLLIWDDLVMFAAAEFAEGSDIMWNFLVQTSSGDVQNKNFKTDVRNVQMGKGTEE